MRKFLFIIVLLLTFSTQTFASKLPANVKAFIKKEFPQSEIRFDGLIILPDSTLYLPLYPALIKNPKTLEIVTTYPKGQTFKSKPNIVILNNDFVFLKVITDVNGKKSVMNLENPPLEVKTGLLPQDMLVPKDLIIPENIKGIIGGLQIPTAKDAGLKVQEKNNPHIKPVTFTTTKDLVSSVPQLKNKTFYVTTCYSKNIHVIPSYARTSNYALSRESIPIDIKPANNDKLLLVTNFKKKSLDIISLADELVIKKIDLETQPDKIILDEKNQKAYITSPEGSCFYLIDLPTMQLKQKIQVNGWCEKGFITPDGTKIIYSDKHTNEIWALELNNDYLIKNIGRFPNVSQITYAQNKVYLTSRTRNKLAVVDYVTLGLVKEVDVRKTPVDLFVFKNDLFVLSGNENILEIFDTVTDELKATINLNTKGFSTKIYPLKGTNLALVTDAKAGKYSVLDLANKKIIKTNPLDVPVSSIVVVNTVKKINK